MKLKKNESYLWAISGALAECLGFQAWECEVEYWTTRFVYIISIFMSLSSLWLQISSTILNEYWQMAFMHDIACHRAR